MPLASNWKTLGALLDLKDCDLDIIQANNQNQSVECLRETLILLLRQTEPMCTWQAVAEAVKLLNPLKAKEICDKFLPVASTATLPQVTKYNSPTQFTSGILL